MAPERIRRVTVDKDTYSTKNDDQPRGYGQRETDRTLGKRQETRAECLPAKIGADWNSVHDHERNSEPEIIDCKT
jgi:hypothetical protein